MEEPARRAFEAGRVTFLRNWPYVYATANRAKATKGKFEVVPFPAFEGGGKAGILGGANLVISTYSKNPGGALKFIDYMTSEERQAEDIVKFSDASPLKAVYDDPAVQKAQPFADELKSAVEQSQARPVSPVYPQISQAIYENVNAGALGSVTPEEALKTGAERSRQGAADVLTRAARRRPRTLTRGRRCGRSCGPRRRRASTSSSRSASCRVICAETRPLALELELDAHLEAEVHDARHRRLPRAVLRGERDRDVVRAHQLLADLADRAEEAHHELVRRPVVELARAADLLDPARGP